MIKLIITGLIAVSLSFPAHGCFEESHPYVGVLKQRMTDKIYKLWVKQGKLDFEFNADLLYWEAYEAADSIVMDNFVCKEFYGEES